MEYHEAVGRLERLRRLRPDLGTETTASMLEYVGNPHESLSAVQITGSNGKGSTARILERILREAGLSVGLYTSPDLNDLRERVQVGGRKIPKSEVVRFVENAWPYVLQRGVEGGAPTFFEVLTVLALWHFDRADVDVAVLEVGIGGRYDATSVVDPVAAAVTNVSLEHTDLLGSTVEEIARDKAQIAPENGPLVTGATGTALETIREETEVLTVGGDGRPADVRATETVSQTQSAVSLTGDDWAVRTRASLLGQHQAVNAGIAAALARQVAAPTENDVATGVRNVHWPGRFEVMGHEPLAVLDGAHNPDACEKLAALLERFEYDDLHLVFGAMGDKRHDAMCRALPDAERIALAEPAIDRAQDTETLAAVFERESDARITQFDSVLGALDRTIRDADEGDCVLVAGSLYVVAEARDRWTRTPSAVRADTPARARSVMQRADVPVDVSRDRADAMAHRTVRFHARRETATELTTTMRALGGTGGSSGVGTANKHVEVILSGTVEQFDALVERVRDWGDGRRHLAAQLQRAVDDERERSERVLPWPDETAVMGVLNVSPDSVNDGRAGHGPESPVARAHELVEAGASLVDVGVEPQRRDASPVEAEVERERVVAVIERIEGLDATISVATREPTVAAAALDVGADVVHDASGLAEAEMRRVVANRDVPVVLSRSHGAPVESDRPDASDDVVTDALHDLTERVLRAERAGIDRSQLVVDPGLDFGERVPESFELLDRLDEFRALGTSVMVDCSREPTVERAGSSSDDRHASTVAATALAAERGVDVVRVHDVPANVAAVATVEETIGDN